MSAWHIPPPVLVPAWVSLTRMTLGIGRHVWSDAAMTDCNQYCSTDVPSRYRRMPGC